MLSRTVILLLLSSKTRVASHDWSQAVYHLSFISYCHLRLVKVWLSSSDRASIFLFFFYIFISYSFFCLKSGPDPQYLIFFSVNPTYTSNNVSVFIKSVLFTAQSSTQSQTLVWCFFLWTCIILGVFDRTLIFYFKMQVIVDLSYAFTHPVKCKATLGVRMMLFILWFPPIYSYT